MCKHLEAERRDLIHLDCNTKHVEGRLLVKHVYSLQLDKRMVDLYLI